MSYLKEDHSNIVGFPGRPLMMLNCMNMLKSYLMLKQNYGVQKKGKEPIRKRKDLLEAN